VVKYAPVLLEHVIAPIAPIRSRAGGYIDAEPVQSVSSVSLDS
jgi:hypothetical protein